MNSDEKRKREIGFIECVQWKGKWKSVFFFKVAPLYKDRLSYGFEEEEKEAKVKNKFKALG